MSQIQTTGKSAPLIVAHKGASAYRNGNTKEAFDLAIQQGAHWIELDVQLTADREIVVYDKWYIDANDQRYAMVDLSLANLRQLGADATDKPQIMTLAEVIHNVRDSSVELLIELKNSLLRQPSDFGHRVVDELQREHFLDRSAVFSFDHLLIATIRHRHNIRKGILFVGRLVDLEATLHATGADFIETRNDFLDRPMIEELHFNGRHVCGWSTNDPDEIRRLCALGIDMVTTDAPDVAFAVLRECTESP